MVSKKMQRLSYIDRITNEEVLRRAETGRKLCVKIRETSKTLRTCHGERRNGKHHYNRDDQWEKSRERQHVKHLNGLKM